MNHTEETFVLTVLDHYRQHGRHDLPWRQTTDPYAILVSELMLQQTQVSRVIAKYKAFMTAYPDVHTLATARLGAVLRLWQGLGYNRRARFLWECAKVIDQSHAGTFPDSITELQKLPGVGPYTAAAICAFAFNQPVTLLETNVRQVYIHHFFKTRKEVTDEMILKKLTVTLPMDSARVWYSALMDYGTYLKKTHGNNTQKVRGYKKQSKFTGSRREIRGAILRSLSAGAKTPARLEADLASFKTEKVREQVRALETEGLLRVTKRTISLP